VIFSHLINHHPVFNFELALSSTDILGAAQPAQFPEAVENATKDGRNESEGQIPGAWSRYAGIDRGRVQ
jgi:hypothetical protein